MNHRKSFFCYFVVRAHSGSSLSAKLQVRYVYLRKAVAYGRERY